MDDISGQETIPFLSENETNFFEVCGTDTLSPVAGHVSVAYRGCLICWGGYYYDEKIYDYRPCDSLYIYPFHLLNDVGIWFKIRCTGDVPLKRNSGATAGIYNHYLYIFGGCVIIEDFLTVHSRISPTSSLIAFNLKKGTWEHKHSVDRSIPPPCDKAISWIANDRFYVFGGYGISWHRLDHRLNFIANPSNFFEDENGQSWNNQLLYYDLINEHWNRVEDGGCIPSPRAAASSAFIPELNRVFLFGGRFDTNRLDDFYELDLTNHIWRKLEPVPSLLVGRSWSTFTYIPDSRKILLFGGLSTEGDPLQDAWELDISDYFNGRIRSNSLFLRDFYFPMAKWNIIAPILHKLPPRLWHTATLMERESVNGQASEAILFYGGMEENPSSGAPFRKTLIAHRFMPQSLFSSALISLAKRITIFAENSSTGKNFNPTLMKSIVPEDIIPKPFDMKKKTLITKKAMHCTVETIPLSFPISHENQDPTTSNNRSDDLECQKLKVMLHRELLQFCENHHPLRSLINAFDVY